MKKEKKEEEEYQDFIIMKIKFPMHDFSNYTEKDYPFYTITHKYSKFNDFLDSYF